MKTKRTMHLLMAGMVLSSLSGCQLNVGVKHERGLASEGPTAEQKSSGDITRVRPPITAGDLSAQDVESIQKAVRGLIDPSGRDFTKPPSIVVGVVKGSRSGVVGMGSTIIGRANSTPDADTAYAVGSITKLFTGVILANEVVERRISPCSKAAPLMPSEIRKFFDRSVSLEDLVTHYSGLNSMPSNLDPVSGADG
ncbi:MAG: serine hydrolase, partial [Bdellovibrionales bacterium]|nr:serine hydrolase [Bdellovibrionales bacterium]